MKCPAQVRQHAHRRSDLKDRRMGVWYREKDKTWLVAYEGIAVPHAVLVMVVDSEDIVKRT